MGLNPKRSYLRQLKALKQSQWAWQRTTEILSVLPSTLRLILSLDCPGMSAFTCRGAYQSRQDAHVACNGKASGETLVESAQQALRGRCEKAAHLVVVGKLRDRHTNESAAARYGQDM